LTTLVNYVAYGAASLVFGFDYRISTGIAWILAVAFAFVTNKFYVFHSRSMEWKRLLREAMTFVLARAVSGFFDMGWMIAAVEWLKMDDMLAKLLSNVVVVVMNYIFSKLFIFKPGG
jgi:putative flippase GtrA